MLLARSRKTRCTAAKLSSYDDAKITGMPGVKGW